MKIKKYTILLVDKTCLIGHKNITLVKNNKTKKLFYNCDQCQKFYEIAEIDD